jgi:hypothetical protein
MTQKKKKFPWLEGGEQILPPRKSYWTSCPRTIPSFPTVILDATIFTTRDKG